MEQWTILDENRNDTGKKITRGKEKLLPGEFHLVVHIWIYNDKNEFLIQKRSKEKDFMPGEWAATIGSAMSGENSRLAACRELYEELGIHISSHKLNCLFTDKRKNSIVDIWALHLNIDIKNIKMQKGEVSEVRWVSESELRLMIENGQFHNYGDEYFDKIIDKIIRSEVVG